MLESQNSLLSAISMAKKYYEDGGFVRDLALLVAVATESQKPNNTEILRVYLEKHIAPILNDLDFKTTIYENPDRDAGPLSLSVRHEGQDLPTVLIYGHGDVVMGHEGKWLDNRSPWVLDVLGDRIYGRGTADNKAQHWINICALRSVLQTRGRLGFNCKILFETDEESGSRGLEEFCRLKKSELLADVLIASDGPRVHQKIPTIALGSRGNLLFDLSIKYRKTGCHSGNWGGLVKDPGIVLAQAIASITDARGQILIDGWRPKPPSEKVKRLLELCPIGMGSTEIKIDDEWGELDLSPAERVYAWNSFSVLAMKVGDPEKPVNAIAPSAWARCHLRFLKDTSPDTILSSLRKHLDLNGFEDIELSLARKTCWPGTSTNPDNEWVRRAYKSIENTTGKTPVLLPCIGGTLPNYVFSDLIGMPTIWVPHSYSECSQHAPNEHFLGSVAEEALQIMTGLFWDFGSEDQE